MNKNQISELLQILCIDIKEEKICKSDCELLLKCCEYIKNPGETKEILSAERPPKKWWDKMVKHLKQYKYSNEQIDNIIGDIWYHQLSESKRKEIKNR
jgi:hypothetical protein